MESKRASDSPRGLLDLFHEYQHGHINRRSFLNGAGRLAGGALTVGAIFEMVRPNDTRAQQVSKATHPASARVLDRLRTRFTFQISVDVATLEQGLAVASAALAGGSISSKWGRRCSRTQASRMSCQPFGGSFPRRSCSPT